MMKTKWFYYEIIYGIRKLRRELQLKIVDKHFFPFFPLFQGRDIIDRE